MEDRGRGTRWQKAGRERTNATETGRFPLPAELLDVRHVDALTRESFLVSSIGSLCNKLTCYPSTRIRFVLPLRSSDEDLAYAFSESHRHPIARARVVYAILGGRSTAKPPSERCSLTPTAEVPYLRRRDTAQVVRLFMKLGRSGLLTLLHAQSTPDRHPTTERYRVTRDGMFNG